MRALTGWLAGMAIATPVAAVMATAAAASPATCTATGGATVPAVVELYTSEGCDSCPPADRWLGTFAGLAAKGAVLPLAFHIDYWDYLGWKDPFADPAFGALHRSRASESGASVVYTPQVILDDHEFQAWRRTPAQKFPVAQAKASHADMRVGVSFDASALTVNVAAKARGGARGGEAWVALTESGLSSDVKAGENRGVTLRHDFVVRRWLGPFAFDGDSLAITQSISPPAGTKTANASIAVIARDANGGVMQAIALPLRACSG